MKMSDLFRFSTDNLRRRKGRTALTIIGVVVGVCAIVVMVSLGIAVNEATDAMLQGWGDLTKITVNSYNAQQGTPDLDDAMVGEFKKIDHVVAATPMYQPQFSGIIAAGNGDRYQDLYPTFTGVDPAGMQPMGYELITGTYLPESVSTTDKIPVLLGEQVFFEFQDIRKNENNPDRRKWADYGEDYASSFPLNLPQYDENGQLLNPEEFFFDPMTTPLTLKMQIGTDETTEEPKYKEYELIVMGVVHASGMEYQISNGFIMSVENAKKLEKEYARLTGTPLSGGMGGSMATSYMMGGGDSQGTVNVGGYDSVFVKVDNVENMPDVEKAIKGFGYQISSMSQYREQLQGQVAQTQMMLGGLAAVSLFVAALNIANTMTMAIYERTREIGVMKVLGCKLNDIRNMFLIESGTIGLLGGVIGVALSLVISFLLNYIGLILSLLGLDSSSIDIASMFGFGGGMMSEGARLSVIRPWLVILALSFATVVGLLSGIAPANRAVKISSLEAIRHE